MFREIAIKNTKGIIKPIFSGNFYCKIVDLLRCPIYCHTMTEIIHTTRIELCSFLHVFNRNPLNVQSSDNLIVGCHSVFRISGYCVNCLLHRNKKWCDERSFRIYVSRTTIVPNSVLPVLTYKLVLKNHADSKQNRQTTGSWDCSRQSEIIWDCISYADLVNPHKKWIHNAAFIEVSFAGDFVVSTLV